MNFDEAVRNLQAAGIENPRGEARLLLAHGMGTGRDETLTIHEVPEQSREWFSALVNRRAAHEPLAYITGHREFWSLDFKLGPGVLVPRPESETLIEEALKLFPGRDAALKIADLGAGSGILLIAALSEFRGATGIGFESSHDAFNWGWHNATMLMPDRAEIRLADWSTAEGPFDLVFSNPPYIPSAAIKSLEPEVSRHEPRAALDGGPDGLDAYRGLATLLPRIVKPGGYALLEIGAGQAPAMEPLFRGSGLRLLRIVPDLASIPRAVILEKA